MVKIRINNLVRIRCQLNLDEQIHNFDVIPNKRNELKMEDITRVFEEEVFAGKTSFKRAAKIECRFEFDEVTHDGLAVLTAAYIENKQVSFTNPILSLRNETADLARFQYNQKEQGSLFSTTLLPSNMT